VKWGGGKEKKNEATKTAEFKGQAKIHQDHGGIRDLYKATAVEGA